MSFQPGSGRLALHAAAATAAPHVALARDCTCRLADVTSDQEPIQQAMAQFAEHVTDRTESRVAIAIFPNAMLDSNPEVHEQMRSTCCC